MSKWLKNGWYIYLILFVLIFIFIPRSDQQLPELKQGNEWIGEGFYVVGQDIPVGEYYAYATAETSKLRITLTKTDDSDYIFTCDINLHLYGNYIFTVEDGWGVSLDNGSMVKSEAVPAQPVASSCTLRVGIDIPEGKYKISTNDVGNASFNIQNQSDVMHNSCTYFSAFFKGNKEEVNLKSGQYIYLIKCDLSKK